MCVSVEARGQPHEYHQSPLRQGLALALRTQLDYTDRPMSQKDPMHAASPAGRLQPCTTVPVFTYYFLMGYAFIFLVLPCLPC